MAEASEVLYEEDGHVGLITLNRPAARNALSRSMYRDLEEVIRKSDARTLVVTGADPSFCSGDDVKQIMVGEADAIPQMLTDEPSLSPLARTLLGSDIPVIAAVNGPAVGWGMELALMADIRVASERARFGELFVKRGLCADVAGLGRLCQLVGRERAAELLFTGRLITAGDAREMGLVSRVAPHDELISTSMTLAHEIASNPPLAVQRLKAGLRVALDPDWETLGKWVRIALAELFQTDDHKEGVAAFLDKREPTFVGR
jgi:enoyl-CoA hydratase/carnithine racemase